MRPPPSCQSQPLPSQLEQVEVSAACEVALQHEVVTGTLVLSESPPASAGNLQAQVVQGEPPASESAARRPRAGGPGPGLESEFMVAGRRAAQATMSVRPLAMTRTPSDSDSNSESGSGPGSTPPVRLGVSAASSSSYAGVGELGTGLSLEKTRAMPARRVRPGEPASEAAY